MGEEGRRGENEFEGQQLIGHMRPTLAEWRLRTKFEKACEQKCFDEIFYAEKVKLRQRELKNESS